MPLDRELLLRRLEVQELAIRERSRLEGERLAFEVEKWKADRTQPRAKFGFTAVHATIFAALATVAGTVGGTFLQARASRQLEEQKFQTSLIVKAFESTENREQSLKYLQFLRRTGLVPQLTAALDTLHLEDLPVVRQPEKSPEEASEDRRR